MGDDQPYDGKPCCQWGCSCNFNKSWQAICEPDEERATCKEPEVEGDEAIYEALAKFAVNDGENTFATPPVRSSIGWIVGSACAFVLAVSVGVVLKKVRNTQNYVEAVDPEA